MNIIYYGIYLYICGMKKGKKQIAYYATPELKKDIDDCSLYEDVSITVFIDQAVKAKVKRVKKMMGNR